jgi:alkylation response protein AidB-like acyl-CoA dehydrogenase
MDFTFSAEQDELRAAVRALAAGRASSADVRRAIDSPTGCDDGLWTVFTDEMGLTALGVPESNGGGGGDFLDVAVLLEEAGRALLPVPLLSTLVAANVLGRPMAAGAVAVVTDADASGTALSGTASNVLDGQLATTLAVVTDAAVWAVDAAASGVSVSPVTGLDPTRRQATVSFDAVPGELIAAGDGATRAVDVLRVALAVEAVGCARRCLEMTVDYLKTREQFGRPIGSFQALQHRVADLAVELEAATSTAYYAAWAVTGAPEELPIVAPLAKSVCADAAWHVVGETIQLHGGIGFTWEHDAHLYFKRVATTKLLLGDSHEQRRLVSARAGLHG